MSDLWRTHLIDRLGTRAKSWAHYSTIDEIEPLARRVRAEGKEILTITPPLNASSADMEKLHAIGVQPVWP